MREEIKNIDRLYHIRECIENVMSFLRGKTFEEMTADKMCFHAVVYNIMIIGEAANLLTKDFRSKHDEVPWRDIVDMRNVLVHGYYIASPRFVWETYQNDLPSLMEAVIGYIDEIEKSSE